MTAKTTNDDSFFSSLSDDLVDIIFKYVGKEHDLFVAGTSKRFLFIYRDFCCECISNDDDKETKNNVFVDHHDNKAAAAKAVASQRRASTTARTTASSIGNRTSIDTVVESISRCQLYLSLLLPSSSSSFSKQPRQEVVLMTTIAKTASKTGNLNVFQFAMDELMKLEPGKKEASKGNDYDICNNAAKYGHLNILKLARQEYDCQWNEWTCAIAATNNHQHIVKWAKENGCLDKFNGTLWPNVYLATSRMCPTVASDLA